MNHQEAEESKATERYLLHEMTETERMAFEDHYLDCPRCLEAVTFGTDFLDAGRELVEEQRVQQVQQIPERKHWFTAFLNPVSAVAIVAVVCLAILAGYQQKKAASQRNEIAELKAPRQEFRYVVTGGQRRGSNAIVLSRRERLSLLINFNPKHEFTSYRAEISGPGLPAGYSVPVVVSEEDYSVLVSLPANVLKGGDYQVNFWGRIASGEETNLVSNSFEVKLAD